MLQQISFLDSQSGKTSQEQGTRKKARTSGQSSMRSAPSATIPLMYLDLRMEYGNLLGAYWETTSVLPGEHTMRSTGECPNAVRESTLSQILQQHAPEKYCLSPKACAGIVRRAQKRGKELPSMLMEALMEVINHAGGLEMIPEDPDDQEETEEYIDEEEEDESSLL